MKRDIYRRYKMKWLSLIFTRPQGKVMFSEASVCSYRGEGLGRPPPLGSPRGGWVGPPLGRPPPRQTPSTDI